MKAILKDGSKELKVTQIWLQPSKKIGDSYRVVMFHCPVCAEPLIQVVGHVAVIIPGTSQMTPKTIVLCRNRSCGNRYEFQGFIESE